VLLRNKETERKMEGRKERIKGRRKATREGKRGK
jgi:hypothetical protein